MTYLPLDTRINFIDIFLSAELFDPHPVINGAQCEVEWDDEHAYLKAIATNFEVLVIYLGWCSGEHGVPPIIFIEGEAHACLNWLPASRSDKLEIIYDLPISDADKTLCLLSV